MVGEKGLEPLHITMTKLPVASLRISPNKNLYMTPNKTGKANIKNTFLFTKQFFKSFINNALQIRIFIMIPPSSMLKRLLLKLVQLSESLIIHQSVPIPALKVLNLKESYNPADLF